MNILGNFITLTFKAGLELHSIAKYIKNNYDLQSTKSQDVGIVENRLIQ